MTRTVLVTGGSGYIAGFLIRQLIEEGWTVHTTVRDLAREAEVRAWLQVDNRQLSFFAADLSGDAGWEEGVRGCSHVAHVASPFPSNAPQHEDDLIVPARDGALRVLRAALKVGVERFVMTSSVAAIAYGHRRSTRAYTEADWTNLQSPDVYPYVKSKTIAERAARNLVEAEGGGLEFVTINPGLVLGPLLTADLSTSVEAIKKLLDGSMPGLPDLGFAVVDVRDVANLHVRCLDEPGLAGERFIAAGEFMKLAQMAAVLREGLGREARRVPRLRLPNMVVRLAARFDPVIRSVTSELGNVRAVDAGHARNRLAWTMRPTEETILDTARSLIDLGIVEV